MKIGQRKQISFKGQRIYIGIDVHLKSWTVTVASEHAILKKLTQPPSPEVLYNFLTREIWMRITSPFMKQVSADSG